MLHAITSFFTFWSTPRRLLLPPPSQLTLVPLSPVDVPTLWDVLAPGDKERIARDYTALPYRAACDHLHDAIYGLQVAGANVRTAFLCEAGDSQAQCFPALPVGLLKMYSELPDKARNQRYAPIQRFHRDEKGWLWAALLLAEHTPRRTPLVTPAPVAVPLVTQARGDELLRSLINNPPDRSYPAPVPVIADMLSLRADSPAITQPLPLDEEAAEDEQEQEAHKLETQQKSHHHQMTPVSKQTAPAAAESQAPPLDDLSAWLNLDEPAAPSIKLSAVIAADNIAFIGAKGSGKTTGLLTAVQYRKGEVIALDPHATPDKWPCRTIGNGRKYDQIRRAFKLLARGMQTRFDAIGDGSRTERYFQRPELRRTMVSDEFRSTAKNVVPIRAVREKGVEIAPAELGAGEYLLERLTEGRKVGDTVLVAAQNDTLDSLGFPSGNADMRLCFDWLIYVRWYGTGTV